MHYFRNTLLHVLKDYYQSHKSLEKIIILWNRLKYIIITIIIIFDV